MILIHYLLTIPLHFWFMTRFWSIRPSVQALIPQVHQVAEGDINSMFNTGKYAIFKIGEILDDTTVVLNTTLPNMIPYRPGEVGQLIKIPTYDRATLESGFDFPAWDPVTQTGGIFPVIVRKTLTLNADIDASGKGFRGAQPAGEYTNVCSDGDPDYLHEYYLLRRQWILPEVKGVVLL